MRRPLSILAGAVLVMTSVVSCAASIEERPVVAVSTNILGDVVTELVGDEIEVLTLMPPNADPHSFEISAQDAARLRSADLVVSNGLGLEEGLQQHIDAAMVDGVPVFVAGDAIDVLSYRDPEADGAPDPHIWTDPKRVIDVVEALGPILGDLDDDAREVILEHTDAYLAYLADLDAEMTQAFAAIPEDRRALVTNHHVFGYLADRFDFRIVGTAIPGGTTLAAPSASDLAGLVTAIDAAGVTTVFAESSSPDRLMRVLAEEADLDIDVVELYTESLTEPGGGADDYLTMMRANTERIASGLSS